MDHQASATKIDLEGMLFDESMNAKALPLSLLDHITNGFSDNQQIGCGGFAVVYKGLLENGAVAVKKLSQTSDIDERKFHGEVECLMKAKHKNIVRFLGYCSDTQGQWVELEHNGKSVMADVRQRLLCFEYLPNGSLDKYIKDSSREWGKCYQIIKGICEGLNYLHEKQIVHSDLKPANILLDNDMVPKITDFGLSRSFDGEQTHVFTKNLIGSMGYLAPEFLSGKISFKSDIFSLGVIIIEILTGKKGYKPVVEDVLECWRHKVEKSQEEQQLEQIRVCTEVGNRCLKNNPAKRPCAQGIIDILEQIGSKASSSTVQHASAQMEDKNKSNSSRELLQKSLSRELQASSLVENKNNSKSSTMENKNNSKSSKAPQAHSLAENKNKSNSSATPQPSSVVENKNNSSRSTVNRSTPPARPCSSRMEAFKHRMVLDPEITAKTCKAVTQAICEFYAQGNTTILTDELYRGAYNMVLHNKGEELYSAMESTMKSEVQSLCRPLDAAPADEEFLKELLAKWNKHIKAVNFTRDIDILMYMDRTYVPTCYKLPTYELGLSLWRVHMTRTEVRGRLIDAVLNRQGGGEDELVAGVKRMLTEIGEDDMAGLLFPDGSLLVAGP